MRVSFGGGVAALLTALVGFSTLVSASGQQTPAGGKKARPVAKPTAKPVDSGAMAGLSPVDARELEARFRSELWPMLQTACAPCHAQKNASQFLLPADSHTAFLKMLAEGHFDEDNHASAVARMVATDKTIVMPPPSMGKPLPQKTIAQFEAFSETVRARQKATGYKPDETFPAHLTLPFSGAGPVGGLDNTFVTYRQLRGKVASVFGDDWVRGDRDLFLANVHLFGGADFVKRFDETSKAAPTFLTGVEMLARDISSKAYLNRTGPFEGFPETLPSPMGMRVASPAYRSAIARLYNRMLFRAPSEAEISQAFAFLQGVHRAESTLTQTAPQDLRFSLTVTDENRRSVTREVAVPVRPDSHGLATVYVDQTQIGDAAKEIVTRSLGSFALKAGDSGQKVIVSNASTYGNVSVAQITLKSDGFEKTIKVGDPGVEIEGAWRMRSENGFSSAEDNNENKGASLIFLPLDVPKAGKYEIVFGWRKTTAPRPGANRRNLAASSASRDLCVQILSAETSHSVAQPPLASRPPKGEAHFFVDQTIDNIPWIDLKSAFAFGPGDGVTLKNDGTARRVVADAIRLAPLSGSGSPILLLAKDAVGREKWARFPRESFNPYNTIGPDLLQDVADPSAAKNPLALGFQPSGSVASEFSSSTLYNVGVIFPGKVDNETRVPVVVTARSSTPIVNIAAPLAAHTGAKVTLDASATYNIQQSKLSFRWTQIGGPRVALADPTAPKITIVAPKLTARQASWEGLCRALVAHPDFLFTRPRSLASITDPAQRRRLQLVKIAQDLVGRAPSSAELSAIDSGKPLATLVDGYLNSPEFFDFYFHRTRLYVESHGTDEQDEPARLWTFLAKSDRPFQELLTANYTVDRNFQRIARPEYHGKTGVLSMKGFIQGKPSLPHFNYSAQVCEKFLGYVFEVPDEILQTRQGITASATTDPVSVCYTCHKVLTPLAYQRVHWDDDGNYRVHDETGVRLDATDQGAVDAYPFKGDGLEAFALQAANKERFVRTILQTHFVWYFGREMRYESDERGLYKRLWEIAAKNKYTLRPIIRAMILSPEYLNGSSVTPPAPKKDDKARLARLRTLHAQVR